MAQEIIPDKQSVLSCLKQKVYYVDFYQREVSDNHVALICLSFELDVVGGIRHHALKRVILQVGCPHQSDVSRVRSNNQVVSLGRQPDHRLISQILVGTILGI